MSQLSGAEKTPELTAAEKTNELLETTNTLLERNNMLLDQLSKGIHYLAEKAKNAEMRQCQTSGEGTDAARMTGAYLQGDSAMWSTTHQKLIFEMLYEEPERHRVQWHFPQQGHEARRVHGRLLLLDLRREQRQAP